MSEIGISLIPARTVFGRVVYPPGGTLGPRRQTGLQLVAIESGEATITIDSQRHHLEAGQVCILGPGHRETFRFARRTPTEHTWCTMTFPDPDEQVNRQLVSLPFHVPMTSTLRELIAMGLRSRLAPAVESRQLCNRLGEAMYYAYCMAAQTGATVPHAVPAVIDRACQFVADNLAQPIQVGDIAAAVNLSVHQVTRLFKRHLNTTPSRYLWRVRTHHGVNLLRETGLSIAEIAYRVGFATPFHFSRLTRQLYGHPPRTLRQRFWETPQPRS